MIGFAASMSIGLNKKQIGLLYAGLLLVGILKIPILILLLIRKCNLPILLLILKVKELSIKQLFINLKQYLSKVFI